MFKKQKSNELVLTHMTLNTGTVGNPVNGSSPVDDMPELGSQINIFLLVLDIANIN